MTATIAFAIPNGAILMTDSRRTYINSTEIQTDTASKIHKLRNDLLISTFGIEVWTRITLQAIRKEALPSWSLWDYVMRLNILLPQAFLHLTEKLPDLPGLPDNELLTGFILAGHQNDEPFISTILYLGSKPALNKASSTIGTAMVVGGYSCQGEELLMSNIHTHPHLRPAFDSGGLEGTPTDLAAIIDCMAKTIFDIAEHEPTVGGNALFKIVQANRRIKSGTKKPTLSHRANA